MRKNLLNVLMVTIVLLVGCSKSNEPVPDVEKNNILFGTTWLRPDLVSDIIWGGKNHYKLLFKSNTDFEIVNVRNGNVKSLYQEGKYTLVDKTLTIPHTNNKGEVTNYTYELTNSRTLSQINLDGTASTREYDNYIKQD